MTIQTIIDDIASTTGLAPQVADLAARLFSKLPGTENLAVTNDVLTHSHQEIVLWLRRLGQVRFAQRLTQIDLDHICKCTNRQIIG